MSRASRLSATRARQNRQAEALRRDEQIRASMRKGDPVWMVAARSGRSENFVRRVGASR